jgi:hypothetical protein
MDTGGTSARGAEVGNTCSGGVVTGDMRSAPWPPAPGPVPGSSEAATTKIGLSEIFFGHTVRKKPEFGVSKKIFGHTVRYSVPAGLCKRFQPSGAPLYGLYVRYFFVKPFSPAFNGLYVRNVLRPRRGSSFSYLCTYFILAWYNFIRPYIAINSENNMVLATGLPTFLASNILHVNVIMAASAVAAIPAMIVFIVLQKAHRARGGDNRSQGVKKEWQRMVRARPPGRIRRRRRTAPAGIACGNCIMYEISYICDSAAGDFRECI